MKVHVLVLPKTSILDPKAVAIEKALHACGFDARTRLMAGKYFELDLPESDPKTARERAASMAGTLLANPIVEDFEVFLPGESFPGTHSKGET